VAKGELHCATPWGGTLVGALVTCAGEGQGCELFSWVLRLSYLLRVGAHLLCGALEAARLRRLADLPSMGHEKQRDRTVVFGSVKLHQPCSNLLVSSFLADQAKSLRNPVDVGVDRYGSLSPNAEQNVGGLRTNLREFLQ